MESIKNGYLDLFNAMTNSNGYRLNKEIMYLDQLSHFVGMKGKYYDAQKTRLLIVGRAVNGWWSLDTSSADSFVSGVTKELIQQGFDWIKCDNGLLRNDELEDGKYYWLNKSPFWRTNKEIWMNLSKNNNFIDSEDNRWVDYIAWTNLYKVAPKKTGNPTAAMSKSQLEACKSILEAEIEYFNPTHILFVTGYEWFEKFKDRFVAPFANVTKNVYRGVNKNLSFAETSDTTSNGIKIVVACRPEYRDEDLYVQDITQAFTNLNK